MKVRQAVYGALRRWIQQLKHTQSAHAWVLLSHAFICFYLIFFSDCFHLYTLKLSCCKKKKFPLRINKLNLILIQSASTRWKSSAGFWASGNTTHWKNPSVKFFSSQFEHLRLPWMLVVRFQWLLSLGSTLPLHLDTKVRTTSRKTPLPNNIICYLLSITLTRCMLTHEPIRTSKETVRYGALTSQWE